MRPDFMESLNNQIAEYTKQLRGGHIQKRINEALGYWRI